MMGSRRPTRASSASAAQLLAHGWAARPPDPSSISINCTASWTGWVAGPPDPSIISISCTASCTHPSVISISCTHPSVISISCAASCTWMGSEATRTEHHQHQLRSFMHMIATRPEHHQHQLRSFLHIDRQPVHPTPFLHTRALSASAAQPLAHR